jgi:hypothetical protein
MEKHPNDQVLFEAKKAHETILTNFNGRRRWCWIWFPGYLLFFLFFLVTLLPDIALIEVVSGIELWAAIYFVAVSVPVLGAMYGARHRPIEKYRNARRKFPSCFEEREEQE